MQKIAFTSMASPITESDLEFLVFLSLMLLLLKTRKFGDVRFDSR